MEPIAPPPSPAAPAPRAFGEILDAAFDMVRRHWVLLVGLWALVYVPLAFVAELVPEGSKGLPPAWTPWLPIAIPLAAVVLLVVTVAVTAACGDLYHGRATDAGRALGRGFALLLPWTATMLTMLLVAAVTMLPLALVIEFGDALGVARVPIGIAAALLPLVVLARISLLLTQVVILEGRVGPRALARASRLVDGHMLRVSGIYLVVGILVALLSGAAGLALGSIPALGPAATGLVQALGSAYSTAAGVVLYEDVRNRKGESEAPA